MQGESPLHENILENISDGVLTVDLEGRVMTFNHSAAELLHLAREEVLGQPLAKALLSHEGLDAFNQTILDTIYGARVGSRDKVEATIDGAQRSFALTTSYLRTTADGGNAGVIVLFSDVTEVEQLQEALEAQHTELQGAYRDLEESNQTLASTLRQAQRMRFAATAFIIALFLGVGLFDWYAGSTTAPDPATPLPPASSGTNTVVVAPQPIRATILLSGHVAPQHEVHVTSPITGKVAEAHFQYGERVAQGQRLIDLDTTEVEGQHRDAQAAHIQALRKFEELEDWDNNVEVVRARQALSKAALELEIQQSALEQSVFLLEQGVVSTAQHEAAERQHHSQKLDYESLERTLRAVEAKGGADAKRVAQLELDNARVRLQGLEETLQKATIAAPIAGVVLPRATSGPSQGPRSFARGESVSQGEGLLSIGDVDGLAVAGWADEVDVVKVRAGQPVVIRGDAFPNLELKGAITHVSEQARVRAGANALPSFAVSASMESLSAEQLGQLRLGMSASLEVVVHERSDALLVPLDAVQVLGNGETWLLVKDKGSDEARRIQVDTGMTTLDAVEILSGVKAGDEVVLAGG